MITRRSFLQSGAAAAAFAASARAARADTPGVTDTEIKIGQTMPYSGPASAYGVIGRTEAAYFKMINEQGGVNGRKINLISLDDAYSPPKTVEQITPAGRGREGRLPVPDASAPRRTSRSGNISTTTRSRSCSSSTGASVFADPAALSLDDRLQSELPDRGAHLRQAYSRDQAGRQDRRALSERRLRQGLPDRAQGRARRQSRRDDREGGVLRDERADGQLAGRDAAGLRRRHSDHRRDARSSPRRRSASPTISAGTACAI